MNKEFRRLFLSTFKNKINLEFIKKDCDLDYISKSISCAFQQNTIQNAFRLVDEAVTSVILDVNARTEGAFICHKFSVVLDTVLNILSQSGQTVPVSVAFYLTRTIKKYMEINKLELYDFDKIKENFFKADGPILNLDYPFRDLDIACMMYFLDKLYYDTYVKKPVGLFKIYDSTNYNIQNLILENRLLGLTISENFDEE